MNIWDECLLRFRIAYMEKQKVSFGVPGLKFERRVHRAIRRYHTTPKPEGAENFNPVGAIWVAWQSVWQEDGEANYGEDPAYADGAGLLKRYAEREEQLQRQPVYFEYEINLAFSRDIDLTGVVDRLDILDDNTYRVFDFKVVQSLPRAGSADNLRQLDFYTFLVEQGLGYPVTDARLYFLRQGREILRKQSRKQRLSTVQWIETTAAAIEEATQQRDDDFWQPTLGSHCHSCPFKAECPAKTGRPRPLQPVVQQVGMKF